MDYFFARQPILDGSNSVFGYELLFRNGFQNVYDTADGDRATLEILSDAVFNTSFRQMVAGKVGFVNFTRELLLSDFVYLFPPDQLVIEVLENIVPDDETMSACRRLKEAGYRLALDDFVAGDLQHPFVPLANIVKVDFRQTTPDERKLIANQLKPHKIDLLAEKVETDEDHRQGLASGYSLFQGYYFSKPVIHTGRRLAPSQIACMRMLQEVCSEQCNYAKLNSIITADLPLAYRMLKLANSPYFGFRANITSILHAITLFGREGMKRFVSLIAISTTLGNKPMELGISCLSRGRMAEAVGPMVGRAADASSFFLAGLLSLLDAVLDCPMSEAVADLPISQEIKDALLGKPNQLREVLDTVVAYEQGDWEVFSSAAAKIQLAEEYFPGIYTSSIAWATNIIESM